MSSRGSADTLVVRILGLVAIVLRVAGILIAVLVVANVFASGAIRMVLLDVNGIVSGVMPGFLRGLFVFQTPFDGAFRGDFAILAMMCLVADWVFCRIASSLR